MAEAPATLRAQQFALSRHLRDPAAVPPPGGIETRRLGIYRELLYNNLQGLLAGNFPVIRRILDDAAWQALVRGFFALHRSHTPLFTEIGREFVRWLEARAEDDPALPPWLPELAHYEWVELALQISDAQPRLDPQPGGDPAPDPVQALLDGVPVVSPLAWALAYRWPVHRIGPGNLPGVEPEAPTLLLVRRDDTGEVRFAQLSPLAFRLLELLADGTRTGRACLQALAHEAGTDPDALLAEGGAMLARMRDEGTLLGIRRD
ncbi:DNA-binding domain-containing protein [Luteimonas saliphila]|uniref:HvfC family RiPP maturation protein n=1 Tax=Luteimonas saliphila TaxID=2804919 RepID=UPI00192D48D8|nr:putative DNA-binding domain-containing protein [Luteimonas saliphila]